MPFCFTATPRPFATTRSQPASSPPGSLLPATHARQSGVRQSTVNAGCPCGGESEGRLTSAPAQDCERRPITPLPISDGANWQGSPQWLGVARLHQYVYVYHHHQHQANGEDR